ncbi:transglycosylase domain-containing protein, partial [bacterium]|nr:transglycosylase domain-containing protein [bacterium]
MIMRKTPKNTTSGLKKYFKIQLYAILLCTTSLVVFLSVLFLKLPSLREMENPDFDLPTQIYDRDGRLITEFYAKRRILIPIDRVPDIMIKALLAAEDSDFYEHFGID